MHEEELYAALEENLGKSKAESYMTEISMVLGILSKVAVKWEE